MKEVGTFTIVAFTVSVDMRNVRFTVVSGAWHENRYIYGGFLNVDTDF